MTAPTSFLQILFHLSPPSPLPQAKGYKRLGYCPSFSSVVNSTQPLLNTRIISPGNPPPALFRTLFLVAAVSLFVSDFFLLLENHGTFGRRQPCFRPGQLFYTLLKQSCSTNQCFYAGMQGICQTVVSTAIR